MRIWLTGAGGFVGSNLRAVFERRGAAVTCPSRAEVDITDAGAVARSVAASAPDALVHCAILNDPGAWSARRRESWDAFVGASRNVADAAGDALVVLVSTDWVFDGTQAGAAEDEPPNPINPYGFLKAASELVMLERARRGAVARISGVQGAHRARPGAPRAQDHGFGYFVASLAGALRAGEPFTVWESEEINMRATPTLATDAGELIWRLIERERTGIHHCCGGESMTRRELAYAAVDAFELDRELLRFGPPPERPGSPVPFDTSLDARATAAALGVELPRIAEQLATLREQLG